jgi:hypothetical protein
MPSQERGCPHGTLGFELEEVRSSSEFLIA